MRQHFQQSRQKEEHHQIDLEVGNPGLEEVGLEEDDLEEDSPVLGEVRGEVRHVVRQVDLEEGSRLGPVKEEC